MDFALIRIVNNHVLLMYCIYWPCEETRPPIAFLSIVTRGEFRGIVIIIKPCLSPLHAINV